MALNNLCKAGDVEAVRLYLQQHQQHPTYNAILQWNRAMATAAQHGHMSIVLLLIERGANDWNCGLYDAALGGHMQLVLLMIKRGADDWNVGLCGASQGGHITYRSVDDRTRCQ
jgi:hypothetical protein